PNAFALFLILVWPIFLIKKSSFKLLWLVLLFSALLLSFSRGAIITLGGQLFLLLIYYSRRINFKIVSSIVFTFLLTIGLFFASNYLRSLKYEVIDVDQRVAFQNSESLTSKQERIDFWSGAYELAKKKPIFGWGPNSFRQAYNPIQKTFLGNADHPHNIFLKIAAENGFVALGVFLVFLLSILVVAIGRFPKLAKHEKDLVFVLGVSVAGGIAHNLIDYNFNFFVNLFLLFAFLTFIRSSISNKVGNFYPVLGCLLAITVGTFSFYEGSILVAAETDDENYLESSFFPRNYYLTSADEAISSGDFDSSLEFLDKELSLNNLDDRAWYLKGVVSCKQGMTQDCKSSFSKAISLNPMNDFSYYRDYFRILDDSEKVEFIKKIRPLIDLYFGYVDQNVHFTAYTENVEASADLIDLIIPYLSVSDGNLYLAEKKEMLETASELRKNKTF
ncbi:MAG: O-antigen ligase family protein, partial [bacterium]|nr:O-antigen ligase family protein [bacterium]